MADFFPSSLIAPVVEVVKALYLPVSKIIGRAGQLKENIQRLQDAMEELRVKSEDVKARVERAMMEQRVGRTDEMADWLRKVQGFEEQVRNVLREDIKHDQMKCLHRWCPRNCWSIYKLGKKVYQLLDDATKLQSEGNFNVVTSSFQKFVGVEICDGERHTVLGERERPIGATVGLDAMLSKVLKCLIEEEDVGMIGLYGMGGVGKTTLMAMINNKLLQMPHDFEIAIWVVISKQMNVERVQDSIMRSLYIGDGVWEGASQSERAAKLDNVLSKKKFVLLIDDVWDRLDLSLIGIPHPNRQNGSKIIFTTRSEQVCSQMVVDKSFKVQCMTSEEALELFAHNVGRDTLNSHSEILKLAKDIARECEGLPLALMTVGQRMAGRKNPLDWEDSLEVLRNNPSMFPGMMEQVFHLLELSYDSLDDPSLQLCFLYCCIFPKDYNIRKEHLINLWIGEDLLGKIDDICRMRDKGEHSIERLKLACLLDDSRGESGEDCVRLHHVIRDMATWIACDKGKNSNRILVEEREWEISHQMISRWKNAERVCLCGSQIKDIGYTPVTFQLKTLIVRGTKVKFLRPVFFSSMKVLTVLDFSDNKDLEELPEEIGKLTILQYLDLSGTRIKKLPHELKKLTHLRCLILDDTPYLAEISAELISNMSSLNLFSHWMSNINKDCARGIKRNLVEALGSAEQLSEVSIWVYTPLCALTLLNHPSLRRCIRRAGIGFCEDPMDIDIRFSSSHGTFLHLEELLLSNCIGLEKLQIMHETREVPYDPIFSSLRHVEIINCAISTDLCWLMHAPKLQTLKVGHCNCIDEIISGRMTAKEASSLFSSLVRLDLFCLPSLRRISDQDLPFPSLERISVRCCPYLRKLPLDTNSAKQSLREINGEAQWWDKLDWDDEAARAVFSPKFKPITIIERILSL